MRRIGGRIVGTLAALLLATILSGHVGDAPSVFEGSAGPYPVRVVVRTPGVVPGMAEISVRVTGPAVRRVAIRPVFWRTGTDGSPSADEALPVAGEQGLFAGKLWLMRSGAYTVNVTVEGALGRGEVPVPVLSVATRRLEMNPAMAIALAGVGLFLFVGLLTIVGTAVRESTLQPGEEPDPKRRRRSWIARGVTAVALAFAVLGGSAWWESVDASYREGMFRSYPMTAAVEAAADGHRLRLEIDSATWRTRGATPLVPDHGKMMHLFLVRAGTLDAMAHLHPVRSDSLVFETALPPLPAGRYLAYGDVLHESGFAQTLVDTVEIPAPASEHPAPALDADDSWHLGAPTSAGAGADEFRLADGSLLRWERGDGPIRAGEDARLRFRLIAPDGAAAALEPYMGMQGHAVVTRADGTLFVHLHPMGTVSMASRELFEERERSARTATAGAVAGNAPRPASEHAAHGGAPANAPGGDAGGGSGTNLVTPAGAGGAVGFPFEFTEPGPHRVWVQVKREGRVLTGTFDVAVAAAR